MQSSVSKTINTRMTNTFNNTAQPERDFTETGAEIPDIEITDNFFMPKKQILRSDGASLSDIYESKRADSWGKILKAQIAEEVRAECLWVYFIHSTCRCDGVWCANTTLNIITPHHTSSLLQERMKVVNKHKKDAADQRFGDLLRKQVRYSCCILYFNFVLCCCQMIYCSNNNDSWCLFHCFFTTHDSIRWMTTRSAWTTQPAIISSSHSSKEPRWVFSMCMCMYCMYGFECVSNDLFGVCAAW